MFRKKMAALATLLSALMICCAACAPQQLVTDQDVDGEYALKSFTVQVGTGATTLKPEDADAQKYAALLALYGKTFTAKDGVMSFTGSAFAKDMPEEYTVTGEKIVFGSKTLAKMFKSFHVKDGIATVEINGNGLGLTLIYENQTKVAPPAEDGGEEPNGDQNGAQGESGGGEQQS